MMATDNQDVETEGRIADLKAKPRNELTDEERVELEKWEEATK